MVKIQLQTALGPIGTAFYTLLYFLNVYVGILNALINKASSVHDGDGQIWKVNSM